MSIACPAPVLALLARLHEAGHEAYVVGGSLRDSLLGRPPHDWDVTTSALPDETLAAMADYRTIETGLQHGTVTVMTKEDNPIPVEITTYRIDGDYLDARHPASVAFTRSLDEDLARRDFTVCAMAWSPYAPGDGIVDRFDGRGDLERRIIRCVGQPEQRFREDALRILRAYRFASELSFSVDGETRAGARLCAPLLARISVERVAAELRRTLLGENVTAALAAMVEDGILAAVCPAADPTAAAILPHLPRALDPRLAALFWPHTPAEARAAVAALRYPNAVQEQVERILALRGIAPGRDDETTVRHLLHAGGEAAVRDLLALRAARGEDAAALASALDCVLARGDCTDLAHLALSGRDLIPLGLRGPMIGQTLARLLDAVIEHPVLNERAALLELADSFAAKKP